MIARMKTLIQTAIIIGGLLTVPATAFAADCPVPGDPKVDADQTYQAARCQLQNAQTREDQIAAFDLVHAAAKAGSSNAMTLLGDLYDGGTFLDKDPSMASFWYLRGAQAGAPLAQLKTGLRYILGQAQTQDNARGYAWVLLAKRAGHSKAAEILTKLDDRFSDAEIDAGTEMANPLMP